MVRTEAVLDSWKTIRNDTAQAVEEFPVDEFDYKPAADLAGVLRSTLESRCVELAHQPPEFYAGMITRFDGVAVTRLEMLQTIKEHELTHRSQMFMYLRLKGFVPATTRRRLAKAKA